MTVQIDVDEKMWAEAETLAKDLNINYTAMIQFAAYYYRIGEKL